ncbi:MAG: NAD kinase [Tannerella sp.]|jgi:NAD+ kinase|nr:NAD kinase [Tannerella sp.]
MSRQLKTGLFGGDCRADKLYIIERLLDRLNALGVEIYIQREFYSFLKNVLKKWPKVSCMSTDDMHHLDVALSVGGDGTFLRTAALINRRRIPILGINTGRLGFLADVSEDQIADTLTELTDGNYMTEERMLLELHTKGESVLQGYNHALNEVAVLKRDTSSMITIHTYLNDEYLTSYQADGLLIATPTGSTAYSMSVNGPILLPQSDNIVLSPVAPHSLNVRPLVIPGSHRIRLVVESCTQSFLTALDGRSEVMQIGTELIVNKGSYTLSVIKRHKHTFYCTLREKLMWGADVRVKQY